MTRRVEDPIYAELGGVARFERPDAGDDAGGCASDGAGEVGAAGVEGEVLAPGSALALRFFDEEELRGGRELVEVPDRNLEVPVGVVEPSIRLLGASLAVRGRLVSHLPPTTT